MAFFYDTDKFVGTFEDVYKSYQNKFHNIDWCFITEA